MKNIGRFIGFGLVDIQFIYDRETGINISILDLKLILYQQDYERSLIGFTITNRYFYICFLYMTFRIFDKDR